MGRIGVAHVTVGCPLTSRREEPGQHCPILLHTNPKGNSVHSACCWGDLVGAILKITTSHDPHAQAIGYANTDTKLRIEAPMRMGQAGHVLCNRHWPYSERPERFRFARAVFEKKSCGMPHCAAQAEKCGTMEEPPDPPELKRQYSPNRAAAVPRVTKWSGYCVAGEPTFGLKYLIRDEGKR
eukprot:CAMPEP_0174307838 /NCGR_PEP_ID=MMETSP0810-20121108/1371_1 /TAXON_ID=73025 ORGANISM="Eutreptiella gymnastica-like, Strain CCMP1594" /NCGR_SAMPLE_ID=MMETSP0810 /ASSEMBLY_ACC=CAM_ASM_000659 /LENGTH=181 /DNA_ID=CAMNT_0015414993 /DNA_START=315 /DNA_END=862 /DNA_ORIENTATION=-